MAPTSRPTPRVRPVEPSRAANRKPASKADKFAPGVFPVVILCSLLLSVGMAFGNPLLWISADQRAASTSGPAESAETPATTQPLDNSHSTASADQAVRGQYRAVSESTDTSREQNIRLAAEAINGTVIQPGEEFSFNDAIGSTSLTNGSQETTVVSGSDASQSDGGGINQVSTALYIAAVKADLEITERHPHSSPSDYAPIGLDATIVSGTFDLRIRNNTSHDITIHAQAEGQTVDVSITGDPLPEGVTVDAVSNVVSQYHRDDGTAGDQRQYYVAESFKVYYKDGEQTSRDLLSSDIYLVNDGDVVVLGQEGTDSDQ